jgi:hypothetical protein
MGQEAIALKMGVVSLLGPHHYKSASYVHGWVGLTYDPNSDPRNVAWSWIIGETGYGDRICGVERPVVT